MTYPDDARELRVVTVEDDRALRVVLRGECDFSRIQELDQGLPRLQPGGPQLVQLDLTHLAFADSATICALAQFARHARGTGHDVQTFGAHPAVAKVAGLLDVELDLGLT
jgi:anti-anti-sigma regulatory factor